MIPKERGGIQKEIQIKRYRDRDDTDRQIKII